MKTSLPAVVMVWALVAVLMLVQDTRVAAAPVAVPPPPGSLGYDVSYPQCGARLPAEGAFAIVGVTNGLPWSANPCLAEEYAWASGRGVVALYVNTANPAPRSSFYWSESGARDPALCIDSASTSDTGCAYNYGWHAGLDAFGRARSAIGPVVSTLTWWLDVEIENTWNGDGLSNAADIQGMADALRSQGVTSIGVYSTSYQWSTITGGFGIASAAAYAEKWRPHFVPQHPVAEWLNWVPGAGSLDEAHRTCRASFTGGTVQLAQYPLNGLSANLACPILSARGRLPVLACDSCGAPAGAAVKPDARTSP